MVKHNPFMEMMENDPKTGSISDLILTYIIMKYQIKFYLKTRRFIAMLVIVSLHNRTVGTLPFIVMVP